MEYNTKQYITVDYFGIQYKAIHYSGIHLFQVVPVYSREDIREQYCINDKELQVRHYYTRYKQRVY